MPPKVPVIVSVSPTTRVVLAQVNCPVVPEIATPLNATASVGSYPEPGLTTVTIPADGDNNAVNIGVPVPPPNAQVAVGADVYPEPGLTTVTIPVVAVGNIIFAVACTPVAKSGALIVTAYGVAVVLPEKVPLTTMLSRNTAVNVIFAVACTPPAKVGGAIVTG